MIFNHRVLVRRSIDLFKTYDNNVIFTTCGHPVRTNSPGCSVRRLSIVRSANVSAVSRPLLLVVLLLFPLELFALLLFVLLDAFEPHVSMFICVVDDTSVAKCMFSLNSLLIPVEVRPFYFNFSLSPFTFSLRFFAYVHSKCKNVKLRYTFPHPNLSSISIMAEISVENSLIKFTCDATCLLPSLAAPTFKYLLINHASLARTVV